MQSSDGRRSAASRTAIGGAYRLAAPTSPAITCCERVRSNGSVHIARTGVRELCDLVR